MQRSKAELLNIKYQLQPHFLFNILNSIYALSITKSDAAPESILKLSNVMRYVVSESERDLVPLKKELDYLKDYIALQLIRTDQSLQFSFTETGDPKDLQIAPLILVNFIENAFKYGFKPEKKSNIRISIIILDDQIEMNVYNDKVCTSNGTSTTLIGLRNTIKRLEAFYPKRHVLRIDETELSFSVLLKMELI